MSCCNSEQGKESGSIRQPKRRTHNQNTQINVIGTPTSPTKEKNDATLPPTPQNRSMTLLDPLNAIYPKRQEFLTNAQQLYERLQRIVERANTAINSSQSVFDRAEQQKALDRGKGFGFGR